MLLPATGFFWRYTGTAHPFDFSFKRKPEARFIQG
jgi:hypothetical protein